MQEHIHIKNGLKGLNKDHAHSYTGKRSASHPPELFTYTNIYPDKGLPSYLNVPINWGVPLTLFDHLEEMGFEMVWDCLDMDPKVGDLPYTKEAIFIDRKGSGYMISISTAWASENSNDTRTRKLIDSLKNMGLDENSKVFVKMKNQKKDMNSYLYIDDIEVFAPSPVFRDNAELNDIVGKLYSFVKLRDVKEDTRGTAKIHMMVKDDYDMYFKDFDVSKFTPSIENADVFYGNGFESFSKNLIDKLSVEKKGVVLFHGYPGTGKTHYIRYLLRELSGLDKRVIYVPPSMVESMADPAMVSFLTNNILEEERDTILLIEDAEPLLEAREMSGIRTTGISNLLNSTDGLLNDILGLVVMCTFNTDLSNIDKALLRPGRLMARKEFKKIPSDNIVKAAEILGVPTDKIEDKKEYSVAELLNLKKDKAVLEHDFEEKRRTIGFGVNNKR